MPSPAVANNALREYDAFLSSCLYEVFVFDSNNFEILNASTGALRNIGYSLSELRGMTVYDFNPALKQRAAGDKIRKLLDRECETATFETTVGRKNGTIYEADAIVQRAELGQSHLIAYVVDISDRKEAQAQAQLARETLRTAIESLPDGFVLYDGNDQLVTCNQRYKQMYPESSEAMVPGNSFENILRFGLKNQQYADAIGREEEWLAERLSIHNSASAPVQQKLKDGRWLRIYERQTPDGGRVGLRMDITDEISAQKRAEQAEQRLLDAINALPTGFCLFDAQDRLVLFNSSFKGLFGNASKHIEIGRTYQDVLQSLADSGDIPQAIGKEEQWLRDTMIQRRDGDYVSEFQLDDKRWIRAYNHQTGNGEMTGIRLDITAEKQQEEILRLAAQTDPMTGLLNRRGLSEHLEDLRKSNPNSEFALLHIDLDKFKSINDVLGHAAGDHVLVHVSQLLDNETRRSDIVARVGGDEFVICCKIRAQSDIQTMARRLVSKLGTPVPYMDKTCHAGASIGIAIWTHQGDDSPEQVLRDADIALKHAKEAGRGQYAVFQPEMRYAAQANAQLANEIADALVRQEFRVWLQPQFTLDGRKIIGYESLLRWNHPIKGLMLPGKFLFAAQEANLMDELDAQVLTMACDAADKLRCAGVSHPRVSVNLSASRLSDPDLLGSIRQNLAQYDLQPDQLVIEILESTLLDDRSSHVIENIHTLSAAGLSIELDDFGTGHAAIASLRQFPVDRIKIDRSLVSGIDRDEELRMITTAIQNLCNSLGLSVICEGVETAAELDVLRECGCTEVQGYVYARPKPVDELIEWLKARDEPELRRANFKTI